MRALRIWLSGWLSLWLCACAYQPAGTPSSSYTGYDVVEINGETIAQLGAIRHAASDELPPVRDDSYDYVVGPGDVLTMSISTLDSSGESALKRIFPGSAALATENQFLIDADGYVTLPFVGRTRVGGLAFTQAKRHINTRLKEFFINPYLVLRVSEFSNGKFFVRGEVGQAGEFPLSHAPLRVTAAIRTAGGVRPTADLKHAVLTRKDGTRIPLDLIALLHKNEDAINPIIRNGDQLVVPRNHGNQLFVVGEVISPQTITLHPLGMSLTEALGQVRGVNPVTGDPSDVYVLRGYGSDNSSVKGSGKNAAHITAYHLDVSEASHYVYADRFALLPRDVVFVGTQPITQWNRFINQLIPTSISTLIGPSDVTRGSN